jgi:hypothetical protein
MRDIDSVLRDVGEEFSRAVKKFPRSFVNAHEGFSVLYEEVDELWDEVKADNRERQLAEAIQVAAMAVRFVVELSGRDRNEEEGRNAS